MAECPICMEAAGGAYIHGCAHEFCFPCIEKWCTDRRAFCPICEQPVWGLHASTKSVRYLTPHFGRLGFRFRDAGHMVVERVSEGTLAHAMGFFEGDHVRVGAESSYEKCLQLVKQAMVAKRMIKVTVVGRTVVRQQPAQPTGWWWWKPWHRARVSP